MERPGAFGAQIDTDLLGVVNLDQGRPARPTRAGLRTHRPDLSGPSDLALTAVERLMGRLASGRDSSGGRNPWFECTRVARSPRGLAPSLRDISPHGLTMTLSDSRSFIAR